jgi:hypothetical protein
MTDSEFRWCSHKGGACAANLLRTLPLFCTELSRETFWQITGASRLWVFGGAKP